MDKNKAIVLAIVVCMMCIFSSTAAGLGWWYFSKPEPNTSTPAPEVPKTPVTPKTPTTPNTPSTPSNPVPATLPPASTTTPPPDSTTAPPAAETIIYNCTTKKSANFAGTVTESGACDAWISECGNGGGCNESVANNDKEWQCISRDGKYAGNASNPQQCVADGSRAIKTTNLWYCVSNATGTVIKDISVPLMCNSWVSDCGNTPGGCHAVLPAEQSLHGTTLFTKNCAEWNSISDQYCKNDFGPEWAWTGQKVGAGCTPGQGKGVCVKT